MDGGIGRGPSACVCTACRGPSSLLPRSRSSQDASLEGESDRLVGGVRPQGVDLLRSMDGTKFMSMRFRSGDALMAMAGEERQEHLAAGWLDITQSPEG